MQTRTAVLTTVLALSALVGAACSSDGDEGVDAASDEQVVDDAPHNDADVAFAQGMVPHHAQALEMTALAADRASDERVLGLAEEIDAAQEPEIERMEGWLAAWDEEVDHEMGGMDGTAMDGMASESQLAELEAADGTEFDVLFLELMTAHHEGAVAMAETEIAEGDYPDAIALAESIISTQESEITEMAALLDELDA